MTSVFLASGNYVRHRRTHALWEGWPDAPPAQMIRLMPQRISSPPGGTIASNTSFRQSALRFTEGVRMGWSAADLSRWCFDALLQPGLLELTAASSGMLTVAEPGSGSLELPIDPPSGARPGPPARLLEVARQHIVDCLRGLLHQPTDDRFVHAALRADRVQRIRAPGERFASWTPRLREGNHSLSQMVLALFTADVLTDRDPYERSLSVCRVCGAVGFESERAGRTGCTEHAAELASGKRPSRPSGPPVAPRPISPNAASRAHSPSAMTQQLVNPSRDASGGGDPPD